MSITCEKSVYVSGLVINTLEEIRGMVTSFFTPMWNFLLLLYSVLNRLNIREMILKSKNLLFIYKYQILAIIYLSLVIERVYKEYTIYLANKKNDASTNNLISRFHELDDVRKVQTEEAVESLHKRGLIENIMISGSYNDPDYLSFEGDEWTMTALKNKAAEMKLPKIHWRSRQILAYVLRITEQLYKIGDIIEPVYPDGYTTEELSDYSSDESPQKSNWLDELDEKDPEWLPKRR
jgi:hypothetical protein